MRSILLCTLIIAAGMAVLRAQDAASIPAADGFQCPVGPNGTGEGYYIARGYRANGHLGDDWNGIRGGDTDMGDPVCSTAHGIVVFARNYHVGWGNVVIIRHAYYEGFSLRFVDSLYGHLADFNVREGQQVKRGQLIGHIGSNNGMYDAHLHFEIRKNINIGMYRSSFPRDGTNYWEPNQFIAAHLSCSQGGKTVSVPINTFPATAPPSYVANKVHTPVYSPGSAPATHLPPPGAGGLRTTTREPERRPEPEPRVVTAAPTTPKPAPVVETPTTGSKKSTLPPIASKGPAIVTSEKKEPTSTPSSKNSKTASTKTSTETPASKESGTKESASKESASKESPAKESATAKKESTPAPSSKKTTTASSKSETSSSRNATAAAKPTPTPTKTTGTTKTTAASPAPSKEVAAAKPATPEPAPQRTTKAEPKPSILDVTNHEPPPAPPPTTEGSPIRRSQPSFRVDRFQDLRGMGY